MKTFDWDTCMYVGAPCHRSAEVFRLPLWFVYIKTTLRLYYCDYSQYTPRGEHGRPNLKYSVELHQQLASVARFTTQWHPYRLCDAREASRGRGSDDGQDHESGA